MLTWKLKNDNAQFLFYQKEVFELDNHLFQCDASNIKNSHIHRFISNRAN